MDNTLDIAKGIFSFSIQPPKTYNFQLEDKETYNIAEKQGFDKYIQGLLSIITLHGVEILYGHRNINNLSEKQFLDIKSYVKSYCYDLVQIENENKILDWKFIKI